jgi:hypothetical protein
MNLSLYALANTIVGLCFYQTRIVVRFCRNIFDGNDLSVILLIKIREHN